MGGLVWIITALAAGTPVDACAAYEEARARATEAQVAATKPVSALENLATEGTAREYRARRAAILKDATQELAQTCINDLVAAGRIKEGFATAIRAGMYDQAAALAKLAKAVGE